MPTFPALLVSCAVLAPVLASGQTADTASAVPLKATGHAPAWTLDLGPERLTLTTDGGATRVVLPAVPPTRVEGGTRYAARSDAHTLLVTVLDQRCVDAMSGLPRPHSVEVRLDGRVLRGCAGDASLLLRGGEWTVDQIAGRPLARGSRITLRFEVSGRLQGTATCNRYVATYLITAEGLSVTMPIATMRGCADGLMRQEDAFLEALRAVRRFDLAEDGALELHAADGTTIRARREHVVRLPTGR